MHFNNYQSLEPATEGQPGKALRSIPDRVEQYGLTPPANSILLDLGCHTGFFGLYFAPTLRHYYGVDSDAKAVAVFQAKAKERGFTQHTVVCEKIHEALFMGLYGKCDTVLSLAAHVYVDMPMKTYAFLLFSFLKPGGLLYLEGHPKGFIGEPKAWDLLIEELGKFLDVEESREIKDRDLTRTLVIGKKPIGSGMAARTFRTSEGKIEKRYHKGIEASKDILERQHWDKEVKALKLLAGREHFPSVVEINYPSIFMKSCGVLVTKELLPENWVEQVKEIEESLEDLKLFHNDIKEDNICVRDGILYLLDFGLSSVGEATDPFLNSLTKVLRRVSNDLSS